MTTPKRNGRPISTGSITGPDGEVRTYLHVKRLRDIATRCNERDAEMIELAARGMELLSAKNRQLGKIVGRRAARFKLSGRGIRFTRETAADGIADLAGEQTMTAYIGRDPRFVRVVSGDRLPRGAKLVGRYDHGCDYRAVRDDIRHVLGVETSPRAPTA
jgi:hypothetical protein